MTPRQSSTQPTPDLDPPQDILAGDVGHMDLANAVPPLRHKYAIPDGIDVSLLQRRRIRVGEAATQLGLTTGTLRKQGYYGPLVVGRETWLLRTRVEAKLRSMGEGPPWETPRIDSEEVASRLGYASASSLPRGLPSRLGAIKLKEKWWYPENAVGREALRANFPDPRMSAGLQEILGITDSSMKGAIRRFRMHEHPNSPKLSIDRAMPFVLTEHPDKRAAVLNAFRAHLPENDPRVAEWERALARLEPIITGVTHYSKEDGARVAKYARVHDLKDSVCQEIGGIRLYGRYYLPKDVMERGEFRRFPQQINKRHIARVTNLATQLGVSRESVDDALADLSSYNPIGVFTPGSEVTLNGSHALIAAAKLAPECTWQIFEAYYPDRLAGQRELGTILHALEMTPTEKGDLRFPIWNAADTINKQGDVIPLVTLRVNYFLLHGLMQARIQNKLPESETGTSRSLFLKLYALSKVLHGRNVDAH